MFCTTGSVFGKLCSENTFYLQRYVSLEFVSYTLLKGQKKHRDKRMSDAANSENKQIVRDLEEVNEWIREQWTVDPIRWSLPIAVVST